jgi:Fe-S-cluster containining protein
MSNPDLLPPTPKGGALEGIISAVGAIYSRIEGDQGAFAASAAAHDTPVRCPPGCGSCCEPFVPDVLPAEAAYAAAWILDRDPDLAQEVAAWNTSRPAAPPCPFLQISEQGKRCAIYPARFLICRLFGLSGVRDKEGRAAFRPCAHMPFADYPPRGGERPALTGDKLLGAFGAEPPLMADYGTALVGLSPSDSGERHSILDALPTAIVRVGLSLSLAARSPDRTYSTQDEREGTLAGPILE